MTSRREFISSFGFALSAASIAGIGVLGPAEAAVPVLAVIAVVQAAVSVAGLFSRGNASTESLLHLQVEMLNQIQAELTVIDKQIVQILNNLAELKQIAIELPENTVLEENRAAIRGLSALYREIHNTYEEEGPTMTPALKTELQEHLIAPLRQARLALMAYEQPQFGLVPIICRALFVESYAMALNPDENDAKRTKHALAAYREWFVAASRGKSESCLEGKIEVLRAKQLTDAKTAHDASAATSTTMCFTEGHEVRTGNGLRFWVKHCTSDQISTAITPNSDAAIAKEAADLIKNKIMQSDEQPFDVHVTPQHVGSYETRYTGNPVHSIGPDLCPGTGNSLGCDSVEGPANANAAALTAALTDNGLALMSLHALKHAADEAIAFIDKLQPSLKKKT